MLHNLLQGHCVAPDHLGQQLPGLFFDLSHGLEGFLLTFRIQAGVPDPETAVGRTELACSEDRCSVVGAKGLSLEGVLWKFGIKGVH